VVKLVTTSAPKRNCINTPAFQTKTSLQLKKYCVANMIKVLPQYKISTQ